ncbi:MAG: Lrp/AsnC family transcriptional regulator [Clostridiales Family XIII bacterium]|nr:Lrp/AsnC family transcriptional regulator [Clostridiales Family XIII bacterium]
MDEIDKSILKIIVNDARIQLSQLSKRINLSLPATSERLRKLERSGYIKSYATILNPDKSDKRFTCFCLIRLGEHSTSSARSFTDFVRDYDEILECHHVTGEYNYLLKIVAKSSKDIDDLIKVMQAKLNVSNTDTIVVLNTVKLNVSSLPE